MTMPDERLRAIGWGGELLQQIACDSTLPTAMTEEAQRIALTYPMRQELAHWNSSDAPGLPEPWADALAEALELFDELHVGALGSDKTRRDLTYTLQHYPDRTAIRTMSRTATLSSWLGRPLE